MMTKKLKLLLSLSVVLFIGCSIEEEPLTKNLEEQKTEIELKSNIDNNEFINKNDSNTENQESSFNSFGSVISVIIYYWDVPENQKEIARNSIGNSLGLSQYNTYGIGSEIWHINPISISSLENIFSQNFIYNNSGPSVGGPKSTVPPPPPPLDDDMTGSGVNKIIMTYLPIQISGPEIPE